MNKKEMKERLSQLIEEDAQFVETESRALRSSLGFEVAFAGRFQLRYSEGERVLMVPVDPLAGGVLLVELSRAIAWETPHELEEITPEKRAELARRLAAAMRRLRVGFEIGR